jgi:hypothetical protein
VPRLEPASVALCEDGTRFAACLRGQGLTVWGPRGELGRVDAHMCSGVSWSPCGSLIAFGSSGQAGGALHIVAAGPDGSLGPLVALPRAKNMPGLHDSPFQSAWSRDSSLVCFTSLSWGSFGVAVYRVALGGSFEEVWSAKWGGDEDSEGEDDDAVERGAPFPVFTGCVVAVGAIRGVVLAFRRTTGERLPDLALPGVAGENELSHFAADEEGNTVWYTTTIATGASEPMTMIKSARAPPEWSE